MIGGYVVPTCPVSPTLGTLPYASSVFCLSSTKPLERLELCPVSAPLATLLARRIWYRRPLMAVHCAFAAF